MEVFTHEDKLAAVGTRVTLLEKLRTIHSSLRQRHPAIERLAVAIYDPDTDTLRTLIAATDGTNPLIRYESPFDGAPSLQQVARERKPRVVQDLRIFERGTHTHTKKIASEGFLSSYTLPIFLNGQFVGFVFFNSRQAATFSEEVLDEIDLAGHLVGSLVAHERTAARMLTGAIKTASDLVHAHDPETWAHLQRMARYSRLIAQELAEQGRHQLSDEDVERIFWFAPMHDLGKIAIPDRVLSKPARLSLDELQVMRRHSALGAAMLDRLVTNFDLDAIHGIELLRQVALLHHETLDGSGYPEGLSGDSIPLPARIVAVADIFDALTSPRPYKPAWSVDQAFDMLQALAVSKLDPDCVAALVGKRDEITAIQHRFVDEFADQAPRSSR